MAKKLKFQHSPINWTPGESEEMRLDRIKSQAKAMGWSKKRFRKHYGDGDSLSSYEAMHVASVAAEIVESHLCEHPFVLLHKDVYEFAEQAHTALFNLYQCIGVHRSNADPEMLKVLNKKVKNGKKRENR